MSKQLNLLLMVENLQKASSENSNDRRVSRFYGINDEADKTLLNLLKEARAAREAFLNHKRQNNRWSAKDYARTFSDEEKKAHHRYATDAVKLYKLWQEAIYKVVSFVSMQMHGESANNGQKFPEDLVNILTSEVDSFAGYRGFPESLTAQKNLKIEYDQIVEDIPVDRLPIGLSTLRSINNAYRLQRRLINECSFEDNKSKSLRRGGRKLSHTEQYEEEQSARAINVWFTEMFKELVNALRLFSTLTNSNNSDNFQYEKKRGY